jgi:hypothetical protein
LMLGDHRRTSARGLRDGYWYGGLITGEGRRDGAGEWRKPERVRDRWA